MKAVYRCWENPFLTISGGITFKRVPNYGLKTDRDGNAYMIGTRDVPIDRSYQFMNGTLTLTDPVEIKGMRELIKRRHDDFITEISFEGDEAELEEVSHIIVSPELKDALSIASAGQGVPQKHEVNRSDEWDDKMSQRLKR